MQGSVTSLLELASSVALRTSVLALREFGQVGLYAEFRGQCVDNSVLLPDKDCGVFKVELAEWCSTGRALNEVHRKLCVVRLCGCSDRGLS